MHDANFFIQCLVYLTSAIVVVPIVSRLGLGSVLGYLLAGIVIGPFSFGFVGTEGKDLLHFAEFGVVMMLFVIGLELELDLLWRLKFWLLGLGGLQILITTVFVAVISYLFQYSSSASIAMGLILSLSSTAIVLQTLKEKGLMKSLSGQASFSVLLFQDIAVIPILAIFPLLSEGSSVGGGDHSSLISEFPGFVQGLIVLGVIVSIIGIGRYGLGPLFRFLAKTGNREIFTGASLLLVIAISLLMGAIGLSAALGTFLAGVVLASSEFRHELESNIEPFKGLLLGLFFLSVGASMDVSLVFQDPIQLFSYVFGIVLLKALVLFGLGILFKIPLDQNLYFAIAVSQVGEFSFVLFGYAENLHILPANLVNLMVASVAMSMAFTPILLLIYEKLILPRFEKSSFDVGSSEIHNDKNPVIICGFGKFGNMLGRFLRVNGIGITILDHDADRIQMLSRFGFKVYFGDATRTELLVSAGIESAKIVVCALDSIEKNKQLVESVKHNFPHVKIMVRAGDREEAYELLEAGADQIYRETRETAIKLGKDLLINLGIRAYQAKRAEDVFLKHDDDTFLELFGYRKDNITYVSLAKKRNAELERLMVVDTEENKISLENSWSDLER